MNAQIKYLAILFSCFSLLTNAQINVIAGGNVGIGQPSPTTKLEVLSSNPGSLFRVGMGLSSGLPNLDFWQTNSTAAPGKRTSLTYANCAFEIADISNFASRLWINQTDGNMGIGTTTPDASTKLTIKSFTNNFAALSLRVTQTTNYGWSSMVTVDNSTTKSWVVMNGVTEKFYVRADGYVWAAYLFQTSDEKLKKEINPISKALDKVMKLQGVSYSFINAEDNKTTNGRHIGFIAQEVEKILPEFVLTNEKGVKGIAYSNMVALLVEAIKEQNKIIESLNTKVESFGKELNACCTVAGIQSPKTSEGIANIKISSLSQNIPNPFSENTEIGYVMAETSQKGTVYIFDMGGVLLKTYDNLKAGSNKLQVNGGDLKPGMYLYSLVIDGKEIDTKRMILTR